MQVRASRTRAGLENRPQTRNAVINREMATDELTRTLLQLKSQTPHQLVTVALNGIFKNCTWQCLRFNRVLRDCMVKRKTDISPRMRGIRQLAFRSICYASCA